MRKLKVTSVKYVGKKPTYNLSVKNKNHNYILSNGVVSKNSHSASYGVTAYITMWLKTHYPLEWMCAVLTCDKDDTDQMIKYIAECKRLGINIRAPDINRSDKTFSIDGNDILFGLAPIKNIGEAAVEILLEQREHGRYKGFMDFLERIDTSKVNKLKIETLIRSGCFDKISPGRKSLLTTLEQYWEYKKELKSFESKLQTYIKKKLEAKQRLQDIEDGKLSKTGKPLKPFKEWPYPDEPKAPKLVYTDELPKEELLENEYELLGYYVSEHPLDSYELDDRLMRIETIKQLTDSGEVVIAAVPTGVQEIMTKKQKRMARLLLEDKTGQVDAIVFPNVYEKKKKDFEKRTPLLVYGYLEITEGEDGNICQIKIGKIQELSKIVPRIEKKENEVQDLRIKIGKISEVLGSIKSENSGNMKVRLVGIGERDTEVIFPRIFRMREATLKQIEEKL